MVRGILKALVAAVGVLAVSGVVYAGAADDSMTKLNAGNKRFISGKLVKKDISDKRRKELSKGQKPFAVVVTCSDSRVAPELLYDQGLGDIFVIRVAGNVVDPISLGSIEYAVEHLHSPLVVVLGHSSCGAVKAAYEAKGEPEGNIGEIVKKIMPAVEKAKAAGKKDEAETLDLAVQENVKNVYAEILAKSPVIKEMVESGKVKMAMGEYHLDTGKVVTIGK